MELIRIILTKHICKLVWKMSQENSKLCLAAEIVRWIFVGMAAVVLWLLVVFAYRFTMG